MRSSNIDIPSNNCSFYENLFCQYYLFSNHGLFAENIDEMLGKKINIIMGGSIIILFNNFIFHY